MFAIMEAKSQRTQTRNALLEAAARRLSTHGYANLALERVAGRANGAIPPGAPPAAAYTAIVQAVGIEPAGQAPYDIELVGWAVRGVLGLAPARTAVGA